MTTTPIDVLAIKDNNQKGAALEQLSELVLADFYGATNITTPVPDQGIDRLGLLPDGNYIALQAKAYSGNVPKSGWQAFAAEIRNVNSQGDIKITQAVMFSTSVESSRNAAPTISEMRESFLVSEWYRDDLLDERNAYLWDKTVEPPKPFPPRDYQDEAVQAWHDTDVDRATIVMATGTGKTIVASELIKYHGSLCLVLVPSMELVRQNIRSFSRDIPNTPMLAVYSGADVKGHNTTNYPSTTNVDNIRTFAAQDNYCRIIVCTYQSSPKLIEALAGIEVNFAVFDEAHRTVSGVIKGNKYYGLALDDSNIQVSKRLFLTATPKLHGAIAKSDAEENNVRLFSMDNEHQYGPIVYTMPPGKAIEDGWLADFDTIAGILREDVADNLFSTGINSYVENLYHDHGIQCTVEEVRQALFCILTAVDEDMKRILVFAGNNIRSSQLAKMINLVADEINIKAHCQVVTHKSTTPARAQALFELANGKAGYDHTFVVNTNLFTEGIDIPALDGVIFADPRKSTTVISQAIGRALRKDPQNPSKRSKIVLPVFVPEGQEIETEISDSGFRAIRQYTQAIEDVGYNPEQIVPIARETGHKTYKAIWGEEEGIRLKNWVEFDLIEAQRVVDRIKLGKRNFWDHDRILAILESLGHTLIGELPSDTKQGIKITTACPEGHIKTKTLGAYIIASVNHNKGCEDCTAPRLTQDKVNQLLDEAGFGLKVVSWPERLNSQSVLKVKCNEGHITRKPIFSLHRRCRDCHGALYDTKRILADADKGDFDVLKMPSDLGACAILEVKCRQCGRTYSKMAQGLRRRCRHWGWNKADVVEIFNKANQDILDVETIDNWHSKMKVVSKCRDCGYEAVKTINTNGLSCRNCAFTLYDKEYIDELAERSNRVVIEYPKTFKSDSKVKVKCEAGGHILDVRASSLGNKCNECFRPKWTIERLQSILHPSITLDLNDIPDYIVDSTKVNYLCEVHGKQERTVGVFLRTNRCSKCNTALAAYPDAATYNKLVNEARGLYENGMSLTKIANKFNKASATISKWLKAGWPIYPE